VIHRLEAGSEGVCTATMRKAMSLRQPFLLSPLLLATALAWAPIATLDAQEAPADQPEAGDVVAEEAPASDESSAAQEPSAAEEDSSDAGSPFYALYGTAGAYLESRELGPTNVPDEPLQADGSLTDESFVYALRVLFQLGRMSDERLPTWSRLENHLQPVDPATLPPLATVAWSGKVEKVDTIAVPEDLFLDMARAYVLHVRSNDDTEWRILVDRAPQSWLKGTPDAEASGFAIFLPTKSEGENAVAWAVGDAPTWRPTDPDEKLGVTTSKVSLAQAGLNLLELDGLRERDKAEFAAADREPFYAMLHATETVSPAERAKLVQDVTLIDLLTKADRFVGEAVRFPARVRRITEIRIDDSRAVRLLGRETYFQLDCVYDLDDQPIRMKGRQGEDIVFNSTFPATVCTLDLPPELIEERNHSLDRGAGGEINRQTIVEGYFFRLWAFPTEQTRAAGGDALQFGPLTIGTIETVQPSEYDGTWTYWLLIPGGLIAAGLMVYVWRTTRGDSVNERVRAARLDRSAENIDSLKGLQTRGKPDFTNYAKPDAAGPKSE
jgi:hypothetical protein